jgi:hypothetical protein
MTPEQEFPYMYFTSVFKRANPYVMKDNELLDAMNFWTENKVGAIKVRPGYSAFLNAVDTDPVTGFIYVKFPNGQKRLARVSGGKIYAVDPDSAGNWGTADYTDAVNDFVRPDNTVLSGKVHIVDRISSSVYKYIEWTNSAGTDTLGNASYTSGTDTVIPYRARTVTTFHRRVYTGSTFSTPNEYLSRIGWSSIDYANKGSDPSSPWTTSDTDTTYANYRNIDTDYKGGILKLTNINDKLNIYKEEGIYRYNESSVMDIFGLSPMAGSIATMEETKEDYFFTDEGFFKTNGQETQTIGVGWYPYIKEMLRNGVTASVIHSYAVNFLYFCYLGDVTYNGKTVANACFVYNAYYDELSLWSFYHNITAFGHYVNSSGDKVFLLGDENGKTYKLDYTSSTDAGQPISAFADTKYFFFGSPRIQNQVRDVLAFATPGSQMQINLAKDFDDEYREVMSVSGDGASHKKIDLSKIGYFRTLSARVTWNGAGVRPELYGLVFSVKITSERDT